MAALSLGQAARLTGKSKSTITRAIHSGRLSARRGEDGAYGIDPAELHRVYPVTVAPPVAETGETEPHATPEEPLAVLRVRLEAAQAALDREKELNSDLTRRLDRAEERVLMLTTRVTPEEPTRGFLRRLWGR